MKYNEILIVIVLCIMVLIILSLVYRKTTENFQSQYENQSVGANSNQSDPNSPNDGYMEYINHNSDTCRGFPFIHDECSGNVYNKLSGDIHVDFSREALPLQDNTQVIHYVYPNSPCCLRTCINDFTYTKENTPKDSIDYSKLGQYKEHIDKNLFFASKCNICLENFYVALKRLSNPKKCEDKSDDTQIASSKLSCEL